MFLLLKFLPVALLAAVFACPIPSSFAFPISTSGSLSVGSSHHGPTLSLIPVGFINTGSGDYSHLIPLDPPETKLPENNPEDPQEFPQFGQLYDHDPLEEADFVILEDLGDAELVALTPDFIPRRRVYGAYLELNGVQTLICVPKERSDEFEFSRYFIKKLRKGGAKRASRVKKDRPMIELNDEMLSEFLHQYST